MTALDALAALAQTLPNLTIPHLRVVAAKCGMTATGNKRQIVDYMLEKIVRRPLTPVRAVSVDLGLKNIGICQFRSTVDKQPMIERWFLDSLSGSAFVYPGFADDALALVGTLVEAKPDVVLIEKQRSRSGGGPSIPNDILRTNILEGMVFAILRAHFASIYMESVDPKHVLSHWRTPLLEIEPNKALADKMKQKTFSQKYRASKRARLQLVSHWLKSPKKAPFALESTLSVTRQTGKRDDLHDTLVQAITWAEWRDNTVQLLTHAECPEKIAALWAEASDGH